MDIAQEEDRGVVANDVPIAFFGIELDGAVPNIAFGIGSTALTGDRRKTDKAFCLFALL